MATKVQRAQAICDALINGTATQIQMLRLADALLKLDGKQDMVLTSAQKADVIVSKVRGFGLDAIKRAEGETAASNAQASNAATVESAFTEAP